MDKFFTWLQNPKAGDSFIYHRGDLSADRSMFGSSGVKNDRQVDASLVGRAAWQAYESGKVTLLRRRVGPVGTSHFEYIALRLPKKVVARHIGAVKECLEAVA